MAEAALAQKTCTPCRGGVPPLNSDEVRLLLPQAKGWSATDGDTRIAGEFRFKNFRQTLDFVTSDIDQIRLGLLRYRVADQEDQGPARERFHHGSEDQ